MPIIIRRRDNESNERLIRRFSRRIQTSGLLLRAKKRQYFEKSKNKNQRRKETLRRLYFRARTDYLKKVGLLDEETVGPHRGSRSF